MEDADVEGVIQNPAEMTEQEIWRLPGDCAAIEAI
jgi:hypothetical protein